MKWQGKLIGLLVGVLSRRVVVLLVAVLIGHLVDIGYFNRLKGAGSSTPSAPPPTPPAEDPYAVLGIKASASDEDVDQAYRRAMSEYHPDRVATAAAEIRELAGRRAREINGAYEKIKRQRGR